MSPLLEGEPLPAAVTGGGPSLGARLGSGFSAVRDAARTGLHDAGKSLEIQRAYRIWAAASGADDTPETAAAAARLLLPLSNQIGSFDSLISRDVGNALTVGRMEMARRRLTPFARPAEALDSADFYRAAAEMVADESYRLWQTDDFVRRGAVYDGGSRILHQGEEVEAFQALQEAGVIPRADSRTVGGGAFRGFGSIDLLDELETLGPDRIPTQSFGRFLSNTLDRQFDWAYAPGRLGIALSEEGKDWSALVDIELDEGTEVKTTLDAYIAYAKAVYGVAHRVRGEGDIPGRQTVLGGMTEAVGQLVDPAFSLWDRNNAWFNATMETIGNALGRRGMSGLANPVSGVAAKSSADIYRREQIAWRREQLEGLRGATPDDLVVALGTDLAARDIEEGRTPEWYALGATAQLAVDALPEGDRAEMIELLTDQEKKQVEAFLAEQVDDRHSIRRTMDKPMQLVLDPLLVHEGWAHRNSVNILDFFGDLLQGAGEVVPSILGSDPTSLQSVGEGITEGMGLFMDAFDPHDSSHLSDYWGVSEGWVPIVDLLGSLLGDPLIWVTPGGKGAMKALQWSMSTPQGFKWWMRTPKGRMSFASITDMAAERNVLGFAGQTYSMDTDTFIRVWEAGEDVGAIRDVLTKAGTEGNWIPMIGGHMSWRNNAASVARLAGSGDSEAANFLRAALGGFSQSRAVSLSPSLFKDDALGLILARFYNDPAGAREWIERFIGSWKQYRGTDGGVARALDMQVAERHGRYRTSEAVGRENGYGRWVARDREGSLNAQEGIAALDSEAAELLGLDSAGPWAGTGAAVEDARRALDDAINETLRHPSDATRQAEAQASQAWRDAQAADITNADRIAQITRRRTVATHGELDRAALVDARKSARKRVGQARSRLAKNPENERLIVRLEASKNQLIAATDDLARLDTEIKEVGGALPRGVHPNTPEWDAYDSAARKWWDGQRAARKEMSETRRLYDRVSRGGSRDPLALWYFEFMEDWGDQLGLTVANRHPRYGVNVHDWSDIAGTSSVRYMESGTDDAMARQFGKDVTTEDGLLEWNLLKSQGVHPDPAQVVLPATSMQIVAYQARHSDEWYKSAIYRAAVPSLSNNWYTHGLGVINRIWAGGLLFNTKTYVRASLDEPARHIISRGRLGGRQGIQRISATGELMSGRIRGPVEAGMRRLTAPAERLMPGWADAALSDAAGVYANTLRVFQNIGDDAARGAYETVAYTRKSAGTVEGAKLDKKAYLASARQFYNGVLGNMEPWKMWAQARHAEQPSIFRKWWSEGGDLTNRSTPKITTGGVATPITPEGILRSYDDILAGMVHHIDDPASQASVRNSLLGAWATDSAVPDAVLRQLGPMPNFAPLGRGSRGAFDFVFGTGSALHGGLIFEDYYDEFASILYNRHANRGKLLTPETMVAETPGMTLAEAERALAAPSADAVDRLVGLGYVTPGSIHEMATRAARIGADDLMYHAGATSLLGKRLQRIYPFGPAQLDFMSWYGRELVKGFELGLNPSIAKAMEALPGRLGEAFAPGGAPFLGRPVHLPSVRPAVRAGDRAPLFRGHGLNLRLAARSADLMGAAAKQAERLGVDFDADLSRPLDIINHATFFPMELNQRFFLELTPGMTWWPNWAFHLLPTATDDESHPLHKMAAGFREWFEALNVNLDYSPERVGFADIWKFAVPGRGIDAVKSFITWAATMGSNGAVSWFGTPPSAMSNYRAGIAEALETTPVLSLAGEDFTNLQNEVVYRAYSEAAAEDAKKGAADTFSALPRDYESGRDIPLYKPFIDELDWLLLKGAVGSPQVDEIKDGWAQYQNGMNREEATILGDTLSGVLFGLDQEYRDYLLALHPDLNSLMVSAWEVTDKAPYEYNDNGRLRVPPGADGRAIREEGYNEGWLVQRPPKDNDGDMMRDAYVGRAQSVRRALALIWRNHTDQEAVNADPSATVANTFYQISDDELRLLNSLSGRYSHVSGDGEAAILSGQELAGWIDEIRVLYQDNAGTSPPKLRSDILRKGGETLIEHLDFTRTIISDLYPELDPGWPSDFPEEMRATTRGKFEAAVAVGWLSLPEYTKHYARDWGRLDWEPNPPPPLAELDTEQVWAIGPSQLGTDIEIVDGDTLRVHFPDDVVRVRLIGINAAEQNDVNAEANNLYLQHRNDLIDRMYAADTIHLAIHAPTQYGALHEVEPDGDVRWLMFLYLDGEPVYDPLAFTSDNPRGIQFGGEGVRATEGSKLPSEGVVS